MARKTVSHIPGPRLTPEITRTVVAYVRAGGFLDVAAEAAGIPAALFADWLRQGESPQGPRRFRDLLHQVRQAQAQARLGAEARAFSDRPVDWLKHGPGRHAPERPGWSGPARAPSGAGSSLQSLLDSPDVRVFIARLLDALAPNPDLHRIITTLVSSS